MRSRSARSRVTLAAMLLLSPSAAVVAFLHGPQSAYAAGPDEELREGVKAFEEGRFEDAEKHFREVLKANPSSEQARLYRDEAGYQFWVKVLARGGNLATLAKRILSSAERGAIRARQDEEKIKAALTKFWSNDFMEQMEAQEAIIAEHSAYVVPYLVESLGEKERREDDKRVRIIGLLSRLGEEGVLAVAQCLKSTDALTRLNACIILGNVKDWRALPLLKKIQEKDADALVKQEAGVAIGKIGDGGKQTAEWFAFVADKHHKQHPLVLINRFREWVSWHWKDDKLKFTDEPRPIWQDKIAQEYCYEGLAIAPNDDVLWSILVCSYAQEDAIMREIVRVAQQKKDKGAEIDEAEVTKLVDLQKGTKKKLAHLYRAAGPDRVFRGLRKALEDGNPNVAVLLIEALQDLKIPADMFPGSGAVDIQQKPLDNAPVGAEPAKSDNTPPNVPSPPSSEQPAASPPPPPPPPPSPPPGEEPKPVDEPKKDEEPKAGRPKRVSMRNGDGGPTKGTSTRRSVYADAASGGAGGTPGESLCAALTYSDKRVRYAAAIAFAHLNPNKPFANQEKVVENLVDALGETGQRVVLVVERDLELKNKIVGQLREAGYMVFSTQSGKDGINRAKSFPGEDLIIISSELNPDGQGEEPVEFQFIETLREDYRTKTIPCVVLTPARRVAEMQKLVDEKLAADVITPEVDKTSLDGKIKKIFESEEYKRDEKARNDEISKRAALAISAVPQGHTVIDVAKTGPALAACTQPSRPDEVKIAALKAIAAVGPNARGACLDAALLVFKDKNLSVDVREAAAIAIGECIKGQAVQGDAFKTLKAAFGEDEERIWKAAGNALGKAQLTGDQAREVFEEHRID